MDGSVVNGVLLTNRSGDKRDENTHHATSASVPSHRLQDVPGCNVPTYTQVVVALDNDNCLVDLLQNCSSKFDEETGSVTDPILLLSDVAAQVRQMSKHTLFDDSSCLKAEDEAKRVSF